MSNRYAQHVNPKQTVQTEKIPGTNQVQNNAGGFVWSLDDWGMLERFLILGTEGGTYYASEKTMTIKNSDALLRCLIADGPRAVKMIVDISVGGRAPKNDPAVFALAVAAGQGDDKTRAAALEALPSVCRIGTHLFQFLEAVNKFRGWGRGLRRAITNWYTEKNIDSLAYQLIKYQQRGGWAHRDALLLAHLKPDTSLKDAGEPSQALAQLLRWSIGKEANLSHAPEIIQGYMEVQAAKTDKEVVSVLKSYPTLPWEAIKTEHLGSAHVWEALLPNLPLTALIRNLARMTANGVLKPLSDSVKIVQEKLSDQDALKKARIHPIAVLRALCTYKEGHGVKGNLTWQPVAQVCDALDEAFYLSFGNVVPTNKRMLLALDVSGSMSHGDIAGMPGLTPRMGSSAMAMVTARTEKNWHVMAFSDRFIPLNISPRQRLDDICKMTNGMPFEATDCSLPMMWALNEKVAVDAFVVYTDNETFAGNIHPSQALVKYRQQMGINAKLIVVGMTATEFTIADPTDKGMLDVVGFDTAAPNLISDFVSR